MAESTTPSVVIRLFGPFAVLVNGVPLPPLHSRKGEWLLALLVLRAGQSVSRAWLAGTLWPDSSPTQALTNLRLGLYDLRRAFGEAASCFRTPTTRALCWDPARAEVDVVSFDASLTRGDGPSLEHAVSLYRGPLLEGCTEEWVFQEREIRAQGYLRALESLAADALARGEYAAAEQYLRVAVAVDPLREGAQRSLMQALAASGNYASALLVYRELRLRLHRELNVGPDPDTQALFERIREQARSRAAPLLSDNTGAGIRPPLAASLPAAQPAPGCGPELQERRNDNLPLPLTCFIGREREIAEIKCLLDRYRVVTLTGAGGCGKTRLALEVARAWRSTFADGIWLVQLAPLVDPALISRSIGAALNVREEPDQPLLAALIHALQPRELLLVLDNCEHLVAECAHLTEALLQACPGLRVLATSREPLGIAGETLYRVPGLSVPPLKDGPKATDSSGPSPLAPPPSALRTYEAVRLFVERACTALPVFELTPANGGAVAQVCRRLDGIPLAIELAAARVTALSVEQLAERLDDRFRLLTSGTRTALPRHQTLQALIDWSYDLLTEPEQTLLRRLSVFAGGWTLEAAEAVCAECRLSTDPCLLPKVGSSIQNEEVLNLLTRLVEKSLVLYEATEGEARYRLLETVLQYSSERLRESGEEEAVRGRHLAFFLQFAEQAQAKLEDPSSRWEWLVRTEREHDNLRAAQARSLEEAAPAEAGWRLAAATAEFCLLQGNRREWRQGFESLLPRAERVPAALRATVLLRAAHLYQAFCSPAAVRSLLEQSLTLSRESGDRSGIAAALEGLGKLALNQGDYPAARSLLEQSLTLERAANDSSGMARALHSLREVAHVQGDDEAARVYRAGWRDCVRDSGGLQAQFMELDLLLERAHSGDDPTARQLVYAELDRLRREWGDRPDILHWMGPVADLAQWYGDDAVACRLFTEKLAIVRTEGPRDTLGGALRNVARALLTPGDLARARAYAEESLVVSRELGLEGGTAHSLLLLGQIAVREGDRPSADALLRESLALWQTMRSPWACTSVLEGFAQLAAGAARAPGAAPNDKLRHARQAVRFFGAVDASLEALGRWIGPPHVSDRARAVTELRALLGEAAWTAAYAEGRAMHLEEALARATEPHTGEADQRWAEP